jgi:hypothetical protein
VRSAALSPLLEKRDHAVSVHKLQLRLRKNIRKRDEIRPFAFGDRRRVNDPLHSSITEGLPHRLGHTDIRGKASTDKLPNLRFRAPSGEVDMSLQSNLDYVGDSRVIRQLDLAVSRETIFSRCDLAEGSLLVAGKIDSAEPGTDETPSIAACTLTAEDVVRVRVANFDRAKEAAFERRSVPAQLGK